MPDAGVRYCQTYSRNYIGLVEDDYGAVGTKFKFDAQIIDFFLIFESGDREGS